MLNYKKKKKKKKKKKIKGGLIYMDTSLLSESVANIVNVNHNNEGIKVNPNTIKYGGLIARLILSENIT